MIVEKMNNSMYNEPDWTKAPAQALQIQLIEAGVVLQATPWPKGAHFLRLGSHTECDIVDVEAEELHLVLQYGECDSLHVFDFSGTTIVNARQVAKEKHIEIVTGDQIALSNQHLGRRYVVEREYSIPLPESSSDEEQDYDPLFDEAPTRLNSKRAREQMADRLKKLPRLEQAASEIDDFFDWNASRLDTTKVKAHFANLSEDQSAALDDVGDLYVTLDEVYRRSADLRQKLDGSSASQRRRLAPQVEKVALSCEEVRDQVICATERIGDLFGWTLSSRHLRHLNQANEDAEGFWERLKRDAVVYDKSLVDEDQDEYLDRSLEAQVTVDVPDPTVRLAEKISELESKLQSAEAEGDVSAADRTRKSMQRYTRPSDHTRLSAAAAAISAIAGRQHCENV